MIRYPVRSVVGPVVRPVVGFASGGETALQAACIAAWDMQETSGPLQSAVGGITIGVLSDPEPGSAPGPAEGLSARSTSSANGFGFQAPDAEVFRAPETGQKTTRWWYKDRRTGGGQPLINKSATGNVLVTEDEYAVSVVNQGVAARVRLADDSGRETTNNLLLPNLDVWIRAEVLFDADAETLTFRAYRSDTEEEQSETILVPGGFFRGTHPFQLGGHDGEMCLLAIFDRALTGTERAADLTPTLFQNLGKDIALWT